MARGLLTSAGVATLSNVTSSASSVQLLAATDNRRMATFFNDSTSVCFVKFGTAASSSDYTIRMVSLSYFELPEPIYTGRIDCIWSTANGAMRVTEIA